MLNNKCDRLPFWKQARVGLCGIPCDVENTFENMLNNTFENMIENTLENMGVSSWSFWFMNWVVLAPAILILVSLNANLQSFSFS